MCDGLRQRVAEDRPAFVDGGLGHEGVLHVLPAPEARLLTLAQYRGSRRAGRYARLVSTGDREGMLHALPPPEARLHTLGQYRTPRKVRVDRYASSVPGIA
eukprot:247361-Rhodomonas_salina.2